MSLLLLYNLMLWKVMLYVK